MLENSTRETYIYIKDMAKYYWIQKWRFFHGSDVCSNLMISTNELKEYRKSWVIKTYDSLCYIDWWKPYCYNLLLKEDVLNPSSMPKIDSYIEKLITNVAWDKEENKEYLYKSILYKYSNLNDYSIPAIVFFGIWWSWKSSFITLLSTIFWDNNVLWNLWQRDITGSFDIYRWQKLIVEFAEITTNNTHSDIKVLNKLKNLVGAEKITVNGKHMPQYQIENIAWFFISSNSDKPIQLDDKDKWNRRFTIIKSISKLSCWKEINESIRNKDKVSDFLAWLHYKYPEVLEYKELNALDNKDKKDLEERNQNEVNQFWEWLKENHPEVKWKIRVINLYEYLDTFCVDNGIEFWQFKKYFWINSKYSKWNIRFPEWVYSGVNIE